MTKFNKKQAILIALTLVLGLGLFGCGKDLINANQNQNINTNTGDINTSNWKTYRNGEYEFEFKYPKGWNLFVNEDTGNSWKTYKIKPLTLIEIKNVEENKEISCTLGGPFAPPEGISIKFSVEKLADDSFDKIIQDCDSNTESGKCITRVENFNNNRILIIDNSMSPCTFPKAYIIKNNYKYFLSSIWHYENKENYDYLQNLFYKLIETVKID